MSLRHTYTLFAPVYDLLIDRATREPRRRNLRELDGLEGAKVLIVGIGTGLDIPHLPTGPHYTGIDLTPAMLAKARRRAAGRRDIELREGDAMALPFGDGTFDTVVMHLILAVVPHPEKALLEAERVLKPGGRLLILDKFLKPGARAPLRRSLSLLLRHIATRTDVVFEDLLNQTCCLDLHSDQPALVGGWFRRLALTRRHD